MATNKDFIVKSGLQVQSTSNAFSASSGALQVAGGAGIQGDLWVGGSIFMDGVGLDNLNASTATLVNVYVTGTNISINTYTGALTVAGGVGVGGSLYATALYDNSYRVLTTNTIGNYSVTGITAGTGTAVSGTTGAVTVWSTDTLQTITNRGASTTNALTINNATASTTNTGALYVTGGVAVGGDLYVAGTLHASVSGSSAGADNLNGGLAQEVPYQSAPNVTAFSANFKWDNANQVLKLGAGGTEIGGDAGYGYVKALNVQATSLTNNRIVYSDSTHNLVDSVNLTFDGTALTLGGTGTFTAPVINPQNLTSGRIPYYNGTSLVDSSSLTFNGFNQLGGYQAVFSSTVEAHGFINKDLTQYRLIFTADSSGTQGDSSTLTFSGGVLYAPALTASGNVQITSTSTSNTSTQGALVVTGGVGIGENLNVAGNTNVWGSATFGGSVTFNGGATYVLSTNTVYTDNILELHVPPGGTNSTWGPEGASKDIGLRFHYYNRTSSTDTNAALVLAADSQWLEFYGSGAESNTGTFVGATYGGFKAGQAWLESTNNATTSMNSNSALQVDGGAAVGLDLWVGGGIWSNNSPVITESSLASAAVVNSASAGTGIAVSSTTGNITISNMGVTQLTGTGALGVSASTGSITLTNLGVTQLTGSSYLGVSASTGSVTLSNLGVTNITTGSGIVVSQATGTVQISSIDTLQNVTARGATSNQAIALSNGTESTGTDTGALTVVGGAGIGGNLNVGGGLYVGGALVLTTASGVVNAYIAGTDTAISIVGNNVNIWDTSTLQSVTNRGATSNNALSITNTTISASTNSSQALLVRGGIGAQAVYASALYDNGNRVTTNVDITTSTVGITVSTTTNGSAVLFDIKNTGVTSLAGTTYLGVSAATGGITLTNLGVTSLSTGTTGISLSGSTGNVTISNLGVLSITGTANQIVADSATGDITLSFPAGGITTTNVTATNTLYVTGSAIATGADTGALQVTGGASVDANLYVGTTATVAGTLFRSGALSSTGWLARGVGIVSSTSTYTDTSLTGAQGLVAVNALGRPTIAASNSPTYSDAATLYIADAPLASSGATITNPWALYVAKGAVKIAATTASSDSTSGALVVAGGVGIGGDLNVAGAGNFSSSGVTTGVVNVGSYASPTTSTNSTMSLDAFTTSTYRTARYVVQVVDGVKTHVTEMTIFHDYTTVYKDEYGIATSNGELGAFDATLVGSTITLTFTPNYSPSALSIKASRTAITA